MMIALIVLIGFVISFFLNVFINRIPNNVRILKFQSVCPECGEKIPLYYHIPIIGYIFSNGTYKCCNKNMYFSYFIVPFLESTLLLLSYILLKDEMVYMLIMMAFFTILVMIIFIDLIHYMIPDRFHICLLVLAVLNVCFKFLPWYESLCGGIIWFCVFYLINVIGKKIYKADVLGGGDIKLMGAFGFLLGIKHVLLGLMIGSILGVIIEGILLLTKKKQKGEYLAFGPYLALGMIVSVLAGTYIFDFYASIFSF